MIEKKFTYLEFLQYIKVMFEENKQRDIDYVIYEHNDNIMRFRLHIESFLNASCDEFLSDYLVSNLTDYELTQCKCLIVVLKGEDNEE